MNFNTGSNVMTFAHIYGRVKKNSFLLILVCCSLAVLQGGCVSPRMIVPPENAPEYVRQIKYLRIYNYQRQLDTGINLNIDERCSIMATGKLLHRWRNDLSKNAAYYLEMFIDDHYTRFFFPPNYCGGTFISKKPGRLYLGIYPELISSDYSGYFDVVVIVWRTDDLAQISAFLNQLKQAAPDHIGIRNAATEAGTLNEIAEWKVQVSKKIEETKEQIETLQQQALEPSESAADGHFQRVMVPEKQIAEADRINSDSIQRKEDLEKQLAELSNTLARLDEMNKELQQEKEKAVQLNRELEERERREKELMIRIKTGAKIPPLVLIIFPEDGWKNETESVRLAGVAEDDQGLMRLEVLVNGRPVEAGDARGLRPVEGAAPKRLNFERRIPLAQGANRIQVKVTDTDGLTSERILTVHYSASRRNVWAVLVGINDYPQLPKLKYAVNDAKEFCQLLVEKNRVPSENITLLLNEQATLKSLRSTLGTKLKNAASLEDMVIIFFAGHGATERDASSIDGDGLEKYLLPWETDPADLYSTAMPMREIAHIFGRIRSDRLIFIADSCYSGASGGRTISVTGTRANITDGFLERISGGRGKVIITASAANEVSVEKDELQHGVFTYYLLEGLRGEADIDRDGMVTVDEAYRYVSEMVPRATGQEQHPVKKGTVEGELILSIKQ